MHRSDIDGLRAIAVLAVVLFHLGFSAKYLSGGFVGVDVFFVISGYLITGILQSEFDAGRFSLLDFYHRRVRRIFPALFLVYAFCIAASSALLLPWEARAVGQDVLWSLGFVSNVAFAHAEGYFNQAAKTAPLLHTWSLSVEEQFYLGLPLLLLALQRLRRRLRLLILATLAATSFVLCTRAVELDTRQAFYLVHCRAWELLAGALLTLGALPRIVNRAALEALGAGGLGLIVFSVVKLDETHAFPGYWALPPCLGTLLLLYSGQDGRTWTARLLGAPPLRWVGLISYSLYLWHWPLIALYNARTDELTSTARWAILSLALFASVLSYRFVERPFRRRPYRRSARWSLSIAAGCMALVAVLALGVPAAAERMRPTPDLAAAALSYLGRSGGRSSGGCFLHSGFNDISLFRKDLCLQLDAKRKNFLVMGDSHAASFVPAFVALHPEIHWLQATASGCEAVRNGLGATRCTSLFSFVFDEFLPTHHVDAILLIGRWPLGSLRPLQQTIPYLKPLAGRIIVFGPVVEYNAPFPTLLARSMTEHDPTLPAKHLLTKQRTFDQRYRAALAQSDAEYYSVYDATCPDGECTLWGAPGVPMQFDNHHLTLRGAELVIRRLGPDLFR